MTTAHSEIKEVYAEMRREIEILAKGESSGPGAPTKFPDPVTLGMVERRVFIRSLFSFIEALSYSMKTYALEFRGAEMLSHGERMVALEQSYELTASGEVDMRRAKLRTLSNVRFAFRILGKVVKADYSLDVSGEGWQLLQRSLKVRDRLMHPKSSSDLDVSDLEIRDGLRAFIWFEAQIVLVLVASVRALQAEVDEINERMPSVVEEPGASIIEPT